MNLSGAMLVTKTETIWLQEGWLSDIDTITNEAKGYFYFLATRKISVNDIIKLYVNGVCLRIHFITKSTGFHPQILKYRFIAVKSINESENKIQSNLNIRQNQIISNFIDSRNSYKQIKVD
jgi:hypothetical protein